MKYQSYGAFYSTGSTPDNLLPEDQIWFYALQSHRRFIEDYPDMDNIDIHLHHLIQLGLWGSSSDRLGWQMQHVHCYAAVLGDRLASKFRGLEAKVRIFDYVIDMIIDSFDRRTRQTEGLIKQLTSSWSVLGFFEGRLRL